MSKKTKKVKQLDKDCLSFVQAILEEDAKSAASVLKPSLRKISPRSLKRLNAKPTYFNNRI